MFDHVGPNVRDYERSRAFYEQALAPLGWTVLAEWPDHGVAGFGDQGQPVFWLHRGALHDRNARRVHVEERAGDFGPGLPPADRNGPPGVRWHENYYGAFVLPRRAVEAVSGLTHRVLGR